MTLASAEVSPRVSGDVGGDGASEDKESALLSERGLWTSSPC
jgi:hypothetical protein